MVGSSGNYRIEWEEDGRECSADFTDYDKAAAFATWLAADQETEVFLEGSE